jgi:hypothetical protein
MIKPTRLAHLSLNFVDSRFDNIHQGQRGFVVGGGPSILDLMENGFSFDKISGEITIGINRAYDLLTPTYLLWSDNYFWNKFKHEVLPLDCIKFCPDFVCQKHKEWDHSDIFIFRGESVAGGPTYATSLTQIIPSWKNTGVIGLRFAFIFGLNPIYLLGIDCRKEDEEGRTHFHNKYDELRMTRTKPETFDNFADDFQVTIEDLEKLGTKIYSCSATSRLNEFIEYVDIKEVI